MSRLNLNPLPEDSYTLYVTLFITILSNLLYIATVDASLPAPSLGAADEFAGITTYCFCNDEPVCITFVPIHNLFDELYVGIVVPINLQPGEVLSVTIGEILVIFAGFSCPTYQ